MTEKVDRRIRKTKAQLRAGLSKLMEQKSINEISVKELVDLVDINRSTFYLHYTDIYNMLEVIENELLHEIIRVIDAHPIGLNENTFSFIEDIFTILLDHKDICKALLGPNGDMAFVNKIEKIIGENSIKALSVLFPDEVTDLKYSYSFCLSGSVGLIKAWLLEDNDETPMHMANLTYSMVTNAMNIFYKSSKTRTNTLLPQNHVDERF